MSYLDQKFAMLLSSRLDNFTTKKNGLYNFRCPYCGDSQRRKSKMRGYLFTTKTGLVYKCHNCGASKAFHSFLKDQDSRLFKEYNMEKFKDNVGSKRQREPLDTSVFKKPVFKQKKKVDLPPCSELNKGHPAREYLEKRGLEGSLSKFYYAEKFKEWTNSLKQTYDTIGRDEPRIVIPLLDEDGNLFGFQGRSLNPNDKLRYVTVMLAENVPKVYGLSEIDPEKPVYVTEGPFDSHFLRNAIAMCGSDVDLSSFNYQFVFAFDNEPRSKVIVEKIARASKQGHKVVVWPSNIQQKDLNDMVLAGHDVESVVESHIFSGLEAQVKLSEWKRV